jgi:hypothetical protein
MFTRTLLRSAIVLGVVSVGVPALGTLTATPAAAFCLRCGGFGFHVGPASSMLVRPGAVIHPTLPSAPLVTRLHTVPHISPAPDFRPRTSSAKVSSSGTKHGCANCRMYIPKQNADINPGGPSTLGSAWSGGSGQGAPSGGGNLSSGLAPASPASSGGGSGQFTSASVPAGGPSAGGPSTAGAATTPNAASTSTLTAVTVCMTPAGACPMERDVGTECQCRDAQGNVYDGIVK